MLDNFGIHRRVCKLVVQMMVLCECEERTLSSFVGTDGKVWTTDRIVTVRKHRFDNKEATSSLDTGCLAITEYC